MSVESIDPASPSPAVACEDLHHSYPTQDGRGNEVLAGVTMAVARGSLALVRGPSGVGKTTLLNLLATIDSPDRGHILLHGHDVAQMSAEQVALLRRRQIGVVYQDWALIHRFSVWENVAVALVPDGVPARERRERAAHALEALRMAHKIDEKPSRLSGGEQQRVAVARAIVHSPSIVIADEPTSQVDADTAELILARFKALSSSGIAVVVASHSRDWNHVADVTWRMHAGRLLLEPHRDSAPC